MSVSSEVPLEDESLSLGVSEETLPERYSAFLVMCVGLILLVVAYLASVQLAEHTLGIEFQERVDRAVEVDDFDVAVVQQIQTRIEQVVRDSRWVRWGGLRVTTLVLAQDGLTWLYVDGHAERPPAEGLAATDLLEEWMTLLPAKAEVTTNLPHNALIANGILVLYASVLLQVVYRSHRRASHFETLRLNQALIARNEAARRAAEIEAELSETRSRLSEIEPKEREHGEEIDALEREREDLHRQLAALATREESLRSRANHAVDLGQEVDALEDLLEEATIDLESKDGEIGRLEVSLKKASKTSDKLQSSKARSTEALARRFRTLYKTIEVDERAVADIMGLGDETLRLKAEESLKRLADEADNVAVRRKVGGLPEYVQVFELGFAGKGRIYYARGKSRRFRIMCVGAKNTQSADLDYLARLPREEFN